MSFSLSLSLSFFFLLLLLFYFSDAVTVWDQHPASCFLSLSGRPFFVIRFFLPCFLSLVLLTSLTSDPDSSTGVQ